MPSKPYLIASAKLCRNKDSAALRCHHHLVAVSLSLNAIQALHDYSPATLCKAKPSVCAIAYANCWTASRRNCAKSSRTSCPTGRATELSMNPTANLMLALAEGRIQQFVRSVFRQLPTSGWPEQWALIEQNVFRVEPATAFLIWAVIYTARPLARLPGNTVADIPPCAVVRTHHLLVQ